MEQIDFKNQIGQMGRYQIHFMYRAYAIPEWLATLQKHAENNSDRSRLLFHGLLDAMSAACPSDAKQFSLWREAASKISMNDKVLENTLFEKETGFFQIFLNLIKENDKTENDIFSAFFYIAQDVMKFSSTRKPEFFPDILHELFDILPLISKHERPILFREISETVRKHPEFIPLCIEEGTRVLRTITEADNESRNPVAKDLAKLLANTGNLPKNQGIATCKDFIVFPDDYCDTLAVLGDTPEETLVQTRFLSTRDYRTWTLPDLVNAFTGATSDSNSTIRMALKPFEDVLRVIFSAVKDRDSLLHLQNAPAPLPPER